MVAMHGITHYRFCRLVNYYQPVRGHKSWPGATNGPRGCIWPFLVDSATCLLIISANHMSTSLLHCAQIAAQRCNVKFLAVARGLAAGPNWQIWWLRESFRVQVHIPDSVPRILQDWTPDSRIDGRYVHSRSPDSAITDSGVRD